MKSLRLEVAVFFISRFRGPNGEDIYKDMKDSDEFQYWENKERSECKLLLTPMKQIRKGQWNVTIEDSTTKKHTMNFSIFMTGRYKIDSI